MKALVYDKAHSLDDFAIKLAEIPEPTLREFDVLVDVHAVGINPGETFIRRTRSAEPGGRVLLGWEFAGAIVETGSGVRGFKTGDRVFGTGDMTRDGAWAERLAVDHRILARIPENLTFVGAASLPIGALTAWEAMFREQSDLPVGVERVLIIGGAGGVGSIATQLLKAETNALVISTASRPESREWCHEMGADLVIDHSKDIQEQLAAEHIGEGVLLALAKEVTARLDGPRPDGLSDRALIYGVYEYACASGLRKEKRQIEKAFAESADGDVVAAHIAFGNDYLCTEDRGRSAVSPSIFDAENRAWLKTDYRVEILNVQQLANLL